MSVVQPLEQILPFCLNTHSRDLSPTECFVWTLAMNVLYVYYPAYIIANSTSMSLCRRDRVRENWRTNALHINVLQYVCTRQYSLSAPGLFIYSTSYLDLFRPTHTNESSTKATEGPTSVASNLTVPPGPCRLSTYSRLEPGQSCTDKGRRARAR